MWGSESCLEHGIPPAPEREGTTWADFLCSQADALLACDFFETRALAGARLYVFAVIEHTSRRIRILGATAHPTADWVVQVGRNLAMDLQDAGSTAKFLIRERDSKFTKAFDAVMADAGLEVILSGIRMPRIRSWSDGYKSVDVSCWTVPSYGASSTYSTPCASSSRFTTAIAPTGPWGKPLRSARQAWPGWRLRPYSLESWVSCSAVQRAAKSRGWGGHPLAHAA